MLHVCRDFRTSGLNPNLTLENAVNYFLAIFARTVVNYAVVGQTNFDIDGSTYKKTSGAAGSLNQGTGNEYAFAPGNGYTVSASDIGRILAIRSVSYGMLNSGLFRITGIDTTNNRFIINYRSGDLPPAETGLTFAVYEIEDTFVANINTTGNGASSGYRGTGSSTTNRIILQSPSSLNWQVRLAIESTADASSGITPGNSSRAATVAPGFGGDIHGDFAAGGQHLHGPLFFNSETTGYQGTSVGWWPAGCSQVRLYMWGDSTTGTIFAAARKISGTSDSFVHFGLAEDEEVPLPPKTVQRLFVMGATQNAGGNSNGIYWLSGPSSSPQRGGMSFGFCNQPITCTYSLYNRMDGGLYTSAAIRNSSVASDNPYLQATELLPVDLIVGTFDNQYPGGDVNSQGIQTMVLEGRRLGRAPFARLGRGNYGYFQVAVDSNRSWIHLNDGMYLPWQGQILP